MLFDEQFSSKCDTEIQGSDKESWAAVHQQSAAFHIWAGAGEYIQRIVGVRVNNGQSLAVFPSVLGMWNCLHEAWLLEDTRPMHAVRSSELFLAGIWCIVSGYLSYSVIDGLMVRW